MTEKTLMRMDTPVFCRMTHDEIPVEKCLDQYVEANAFSAKESNCYRCPQGQRVRSLVARS